MRRLAGSGEKELHMKWAHASYNIIFNSCWLSYLDHVNYFALWHYLRINCCLYTLTFIIIHQIASLSNNQMLVQDLCFEAQDLIWEVLGCGDPAWLSSALCSLLMSGCCLGPVFFWLAVRYLLFHQWSGSSSWQQTSTRRVALILPWCSLLSNICLCLFCPNPLK